MIKNTVIVCLTLLLIVSNGWHFSARLEQSLTITDMNGAQSELRHSLEQLAVLVSHFMQGQSVSEVETLLTNLFPEAVQYTDAEYIHSDFLSFTIDPTAQYIESVAHNPDK